MEILDRKHESWVVNSNEVRKEAIFNMEMGSIAGIENTLTWYNFFEGCILDMNITHGSP